MDFPAHGNVGDSAIWVGERVVLAEIGAEVAYVAGLGSYSPAALAGQAVAAGQAGIRVRAGRRAVDARLPGLRAAPGWRPRRSAESGRIAAPGPRAASLDRAGRWFYGAAWRAGRLTGSVRHRVPCL
ncbi:hypothetical protein [Actinokineospora iranica]|uniref:hypothetical protein n=1 Tax=Actinokineospora iranica TaxID=1271860 RepID=UPI001587E24D|nr:hypothetical protein [Actinokineospora iranica]